MALNPLFNYDTPNWPRRLLDQDFGLTLRPEDLMAAVTSPIISRLRPWWPKDAGSSIKIDEAKWQVNIDVQHFSPEEITVKIANGSVVVEGKHEEKQDEHGFITRQFIRRFKLPEDSDSETVQSRLSSDGVLTVVAPKKEDKLKGERTIPITHTGPIRKEVVDDLPSTDKKEVK